MLMLFFTIRGVFIDFATRRRRVPVVDAALAVERTEQPVGLNHFAHPLQAARRAFFLDEEHGIVFAGGRNAG